MPFLPMDCHVDDPVDCGTHTFENPNVLRSAPMLAPAKNLGKSVQSTAETFLMKNDWFSSEVPGL